MDGEKNGKNIKEYNIKLGDKNKQYKLLMYENKKKYETLINIMRYSKTYDTWICLYSKSLPYLDPHFYNQVWNITDNKVLVLYSPPQGSGAYLSYIVLGAEKGTIKEYASEDMMFQGSINFEKAQLIQGISTQYRVWKRLGDKLVLAPYRVPEYPGAIIIRYSISEDGKVVTDRKEYTAAVGDVMQFIREDFNDITDRLLVSGECVDFVKIATFKIICKAKIEATIIPNGYDWDKAVNIYIIVK